MLLASNVITIIQYYMPQRIPECVLTPLEVRTALAGAGAGAVAGDKLLWKP